MAVSDELVSLGCDYITVTDAGGADNYPLRNLASGIFRHQATTGNRPRSWGLSGFRGFKCGGVEVGTRENDLIVRLSSDVAQRSWKQCAALAASVTRFDVQATFRVDGSVTSRIDSYREQAQLDSGKTGHKKVVRWVADNRGGYTLYLGARESLVFGRIYDKHVQSRMDHYKQCIRFEVQYQREAARVMVNRCLSTGSPIPHFASGCREFFSGRGVDLRLQYVDGATMSCSRRRSDADRNLAWLSASVRPTVLRLMAEGRGEEVLRALGLVVDEADDMDHVEELDQTM